MGHHWGRALVALKFSLLLIYSAPAATVSGSMSEEEVAETCQIILGKIQRWERVEQAFLEASELYADNPVFRALEMQRRLPANALANSLPFYHKAGRQISVRRDRYYRKQVRTFDWLVPQIGSGGQPSLRAIPDFEFNAIRYFGVRDVRTTGRTINLPGDDRHPTMKFREFEFHPHRGTQVIQAWGHGLTGVVSNSGRSFTQLRIQNSIREEGITERMLRGGDNPLWVETATVAIDAPHHGAGPSGKQWNYENSVSWRKRYYQSLKKFGLPVSAGTRSGENLALSMVYDQVDGMEWMSPMHPVFGYGETLQGYLNQNIIEVEKRGEVVPVNPLAFKWFTDFREQMIKRSGWWEEDHPFGETPLLIMVGELDKEVPFEARVAFRQMARNNPGRIFYVEVPGGYHDLFAVTENWHGKSQRWSPAAEERAAKVWAYHYWFVRSQILKEPNVPVPPFGWLLE